MPEWENVQGKCHTVGHSGLVEAKKKKMNNKYEK